MSEINKLKIKARKTTIRMAEVLLNNSNVSTRALEKFSPTELNCSVFTRLLGSQNN